LETFCPAQKIAEGEDATVHFENKDMAAGAYTLSVKKNGIFIGYGDTEGLRNAIASLSFLIKKDGIDCAEIKDAPDHTFRACLLDLARGYVAMDALKEHIVRMAKLKYSVLHLHLMDRQTYCLESDVVPNPDGHKLYSKDDMRELITLAINLGLEVIPEIEFPCHAVNLLKAIPALSCDIIDKRAAIEKVRAAKSERKMEFVDSERGVSQWAVCPGKESTYEIYERIIDEICELFPGKYLHIGGDEFEFPSLAAHTHWDNCYACRARMEKEGFSSTRELYYYGLRRLNQMLKARGKRMAAWNDQIDVFKPLEIPKDTLIYFWHGTLLTKEKGVFQKLLDLGFDVVNAHYKYTYFDHDGEMQESNIRTWTTKTDTLGEPELHGNILGGMLSCWDFAIPEYAHNHYVLPPAMVLFSDRVWNDLPCEYDESYRKAMFAAISGDNEVGIDMFRFFREILPPRCRHVRHFLEDVDLDSIELAALEETIQRIDASQQSIHYGPLSVKELKRLLVCIHTAIK
jgi:hexosaminidase